MNYIYTSFIVIFILLPCIFSFDIDTNKLNNCQFINGHDHFFDLSPLVLDKNAQPYSYVKNDTNANMELYFNVCGSMNTTQCPYPDSQSCEFVVFKGANYHQFNIKHSGENPFVSENDKEISLYYTDELLDVTVFYIFSCNESVDTLVVTDFLDMEDLIFISINSKHACAKQLSKYPKIKSVSSIPLDSKSEITIYGDNFKKNSFNLSLETGYAVEPSISCRDIKILNSQSATCLLNSVGKKFLSLDNIYNVSFIVYSNSDNIVVPCLGIDSFKFLPKNKQCPNGCSGNGICNGAQDCICDDGYGTYDCSIEIDTEYQFSKPTFKNLNGFKFIDIDGIDFDIKLSHILDVNEFYYSHESSYIKSYHGAKQYQQNGFQVLNVSISPLVNNLYFSTKFINDNRNNQNHHGTLIPTPNGSMFLNISLQGQNLTFPTNHLEIIFEIKSSDSELSIKQDNQFVMLSNSDSLLQIAVSQLFTDGKSIQNGDVSIRVIDQDDYSDLLGKKFSTSSTYLSIQIPTTKSTNSNVALSFSPMVKKSSSDSNNKWRIIVAVVVPVVGVLVIVGIVIYLIKIKKIQFTKK